MIFWVNENSSIIYWNCKDTGAQKRGFKKREYKILPCFPFNTQEQSVLMRIERYLCVFTSVEQCHCSSIRKQTYRDSDSFMYIKKDSGLGGKKRVHA